MQKRKHRHNSIRLLVGIFLLAFLSLYSAKTSFLTTLALEQNTRCGIAEHVHSVLCYDSEGILNCDIEEHIHRQNCYLLLLEENDINHLLEEIDNTQDKSLEGVMADAVGKAVTLNSQVTESQQEELLVASQSEMPSSQVTETISTLNETIVQNNIEPAVVLNEGLAQNHTDNLPTGGGAMLTTSIPTALFNNQDLQGTGTQQTSQPNATSQGMALFSVGDSPNTSGRKVNFYANIDGTWTCIGTMDYFLQNNYRTLNTNDMMDYINEALGTSLTTNGLLLRYASSQNGSYNSSAKISSTYTTFDKKNTNSAIHVRLMNTNYTNMQFYSVTFNYPDGTSQVRYVKSGSKITIPTGNYSWTSGNNTYEAGASVTINQKTTFTGTELGPITWVELLYDVDFPTVSGVTVATKPTIAGYAGTTLTEYLSEGLGTTVKSISQQEVEGKVTSQTAIKLSRIIRFSGWRVGNSEIILKPNTRLTWEDLVAYASGNYLELTAVWEYDARQTASFFIRYDSVAVDTNGNITNQDSDKYTPELFATYVGNATKYSWSDNQDNYSISDTTSDNSYGADQQIRALYGEKTEGVWLQSFPSDDFIFESLKEYASAKKLSVNGVPVNVEDLNENGYAIRWYVFKSQSDAWHIDGKLVRKEGLMRISKTFSGNKQAIEKAKETFYIDAYNQDENTHVILTLDGSGQQYVSYDASTDTYLWEIKEVEYGEHWTITEHPEIPQQQLSMMAGRPAAATPLPTASPIPVPTPLPEATVTPETTAAPEASATPDATAMPEATTSPEVTAVPETTASPVATTTPETTGTPEATAAPEVTASPAATMALDVTFIPDATAIPKAAAAPEVTMSPEATIAPQATATTVPKVKAASPSLNATGQEHTYHTYSEYIVTDALGGQATEGAVQGSSLDVTGMTYAFDAGEEVLEIAFTNIYHTSNAIILKKQDARTGTSIGGAVFNILQNGKIMTFSYDAETESYTYDPDGDTTALSGTANGYFEIFIDQFSYDLGNIIVREVTAPEGYTPIGDIEIGYTDASQTQIGLVSDSPMADYRNGVLLISNSTDSTSVTVEKKWDCPSTEWKDITVQLLANGRLVTALLPGVAPTATLNAANQYTYTWSGLPAFANGSEIVWSVRETRIGSEQCKNDYTFSNWLVDYSLPIYTYGTNGKIINTKFTVTNVTRRTMLRLTKTDMAGTVQLGGASFTLQLLLPNGNVDTTFTQRIGTTESDGTLLFDNLMYGKYVLAETAAPPGYMQIPDPIYLTIEESGAITIEENYYAQPGSNAFHIVVKNNALEPLPGTGASPPLIMYVTGVLLTAAALMYIIHLKNKRKGAQIS